MPSEIERTGRRVTPTGAVERIPEKLELYHIREALQPLGPIGGRQGILNTVITHIARQPPTNLEAILIPTISSRQEMHRSDVAREAMRAWVAGDHEQIAAMRDSEEPRDARGVPNAVRETLSRLHELMRTRQHNRAYSGHFQEALATRASEIAGALVRSGRSDTYTAEDSVEKFLNEQQPLLAEKINAEISRHPAAAEQLTLLRRLSQQTARRSTPVEQELLRQLTEAMAHHAPAGHASEEEGAEEHGGHAAEEHEEHH